jgi:phage shock protein PspC (stress-responsive transcriptional regulator)
MSMTEELAQLHELHRAGGLSDDEFARAKARLIDTPSPLLAGVVGVGTLRRSRQERWIAGVCGGLAQGTGTAPWVWRLLFALLLCWGGAGLVVYLLMWFFVPSD